MSSIIRVGVGCALFAATLFQPVTVSAAAPAVADCAALQGLAAPDFVIHEARLVAAGPAPGFQAANDPPAELPEHCLMRATLSPRTGTHGESFGIGFELRLPVAWNGRFLFEGGAGMDGLPFPAYGSLYGRLSPNALSRGFAVVRTDSGHRSSGMADGRFALDQQARIDYAFNALDKVTLKAKELVAKFYGRAAQRSYFVGCSNGGRQAMSVAERFPLYFDGIVAGDPSFNVSHVAVRSIWALQRIARIAPKDAAGQPVLARAFSEANLKLVEDAVLRQCDALDGLADGMINDMAACHFDPHTLACHDKSSAGCLTKDQAQTLQALFEGPRDPQDRLRTAGFPYDTGMTLAWRSFYLGRPDSGNSSPVMQTLMGPTLVYHSLTPPEPATNPLTVNIDQAWQRVAQTAALNDADWTFLNSFAAHGKLILYQGNSDPGLSAKELVSWYERLAVDTGGQTQDWARLFLVPGMFHCGGGRATDQFDPLQALQDWVEEGKAPERLQAQGSQLPGLTRPLCPWPKVARYAGGDPREAGSFQCR